MDKLATIVNRWRVLGLAKAFNTWKEMLLPKATEEEEDEQKESTPQKEEEELEQPSKKQKQEPKQKQKQKQPTKEGKQEEEEVTKLPKPKKLISQREIASVTCTYLLSIIVIQQV